MINQHSPTCLASQEVVREFEANLTAVKGPKYAKGVIALANLRQYRQFMPRSTIATRDPFLRAMAQVTQQFALAIGEPNDIAMRTDIEMMWTAVKGVRQAVVAR